MIEGTSMFLWSVRYQPNRSLIPIPVQILVYARRIFVAMLGADAAEGGTDTWL